MVEDKETVEDKWGFINVNVRQLRKKDMILLILMQDGWGQQETAEAKSGFININVRQLKTKKTVEDEWKVFY